jgi:hypothetical protein
MKPHIDYRYGAWWCHVRPYIKDATMGMSCIGGPVDAYNNWKAQNESDQA